MQKTRRIRRFQVLALLFAMIPALLAWEPSPGNLQTISKDDDQFYNYDFEEERDVYNKVDWPVDIIFWYDPSITKIYGIYWGPAGWPDAEMHLKLNDGNQGTGWVWDQDYGTKSSYNDYLAKHTRPYAPGGTRMYNETWGGYILATSHWDYSQFGYIPYAGYSESAEYELAQIAQAQGYVVQSNAFDMKNREDPRTETRILPYPIEHRWSNDQYATLIKVFDYASHTSLGQALRADGVVLVPVSFDSVNHRVDDTPVQKNLQNYMAQASYVYSPPVGQPPKGTGIELLHVDPGDAPFNTPGADINNPAGKTKFWQTVPGGSPAGITIARPLPILIGSALEKFDLEMDYRSVYTTTSESVALKQPVKLSYQRGDANKDGLISITDSLFIAQYLAGLRDLSTLGALNAATPAHDSTDQTPPEQKGDKITITDALFIAQYLAGLRDAWFNSLGSSPSLNPAAAGKVSVELSPSRVRAGETATTPVLVKGISAGSTGLGAYDLKLTFDPKVIRVERVEPDGKAFAGPAAFNIDNNKGIVYLNGFQPNIPGPTGDLILAFLVIKVNTKAGDVSEISVTVTTLSDSLGNPIPASVAPGKVTVSAS